MLLLSRHWQALSLVCMLILGLNSPTQASPTTNVYNVGPQTTQAYLGQYLFLLSEETPLTLDDVLTPERQAQFKQVEQAEPNLGFVDGGYWFRLHLRDPQLKAGATSDWYLELDYPFLDHIEVYSPTTNGLFSQQIVGDKYPFLSRDIDLSSYLFPITLASGETQTYYFRVRTTTSLQFPLAIWAHQSYVEHSAVKQYWLGAFYGVMLVMILYNFFVYLSVRDNAYVLYILYITSVMITNLIISGVAFQHLWPNSPDIANIAFALSSPITLLLGLLFTRSFLQTSHYGAGIDRTIKIVAALCALYLVAPFVLSQHLSTVFAVFIPIPVGLLIVGTGLYGVIIRDRRAYIFTLAWSALIAGFIARALMQFEILPTLFITQYASQIGTTAETILLSLALADRINSEKAQKIAAVQAALNAVEKQQETEQKLVYQSYHDQLTGAPNRLQCLQRLQEIVLTANPLSEKYLVCTVHLNNFHDINFTLGHQAGDQILIEAVQNLDAELSEWRGIQKLNVDGEADAYIGIMEGVYLAFILRGDINTDEQKAVEKLIKKLAQPFHFNDMVLDLGGHIGVTCWPSDDLSSEGLMRKAMIAVRAAKWSKLPLVCYDANIDKYSESRLSLMGELITAIEKNELVLHYQPKIDVQTGQVVSMEALVRWQHPKHGLLSPDHFIDIAESTGIIQPLTDWVINAALDFCGHLRANGNDLSVAVNISVRNLLNKGFCESVIASIQQKAFPARKLILEVIESAVIEDMDQAIQTLESLECFGVKMALDDFGTGYSSLSYLKKLPVHELKIDRSFVTDLLTNKEDLAIVEASIAIAKQFNLRTVAEGIEDEQTLTQLKSMGCDIAQGYHIQRPLPADKFEEWLAQQKVAQLMN